MNKKGLLLLLIAATAFSTLAIFMKVAFGAGVNLTTLLAFRFLFSSLFCFFALTVTQKKLALPLSQWWRIFALGGVVHVLVSIFYAISVQRLPASLTGLIFYLYPAMVTGLALLIEPSEIDGAHRLFCRIAAGSGSFAWRRVHFRPAVWRCCRFCAGLPCTVEPYDPDEPVPVTDGGLVSSSHLGRILWVWDIVGRFAVESAAGCLGRHFRDRFFRQFYRNCVVFCRYASGRTF